MARVEAPEGAPDANASDSDVELVARMARGDRSALGSLFERHAPRLLGIGTAIVADPSEAEDVLQEVFLEAFRRSRTFDPNRGSVLSWLVVRMRSRSLDRRKSVASRRHVSEEAMPTSAPTEDADAETALGAKAMDHRRLARAVAELQGHHAEVLMLGYFEDLSCSEIGMRLGIPVGTVKSRVRRALELLREKLHGGTRGSA